MEVWREKKDLINEEKRWILSASILETGRSENVAGVDGVHEH